MKYATILIVEDEPILAEIMFEWLSRRGYRVLIAENGQVALEKITTQAINVIITDVRMPVMDGIALLRKLRRMGQYKPSIILMSGFNDLPLREAYGLGVEASLEKPFEHDDMVAALEKILTDRNELLSRPWQGQCAALLEGNFESLSQAGHDGLIAFGRGGFCVHSCLALKEAPVRLALHFVEGKKTISGVGFVRWSALPEEQIGVELMYLDSACRDWVCRLTDDNLTHSFIPSSSHATEFTSEKVLAS
jgi:CheY-like chemotaxis protein